MRGVSLPVQLGIVILGVIAFGGLVNTYTIELFYTFSLVFKEFLGFILPFMVFAYVTTGILAFKRNAPAVLGITLAAIFVSNGLVAFLSYFAARSFFSFSVCSDGTQLVLDQSQTIVPLIAFHLPVLINSIYMLIAALGIGLTFSFFPNQEIIYGLYRFKDFIELILKKVFIPLLPLYIAGFLLKMRYEGTFFSLGSHYGTTFVFIVILQILYLFWFYFLASGFSIQKARRAIANALPSYITAFSTMSSVATIPVSIDAATKNTGNRPLSDMAMPIMANVHLLGDSIGTPILALVTMMIFKGCLPTLMEYAIFVFYFCTAMFAVSGIPGGGILVMMPVLKMQFGFTPEMVSIITTLYLLMDAFGTAANVMGDGALVIIVNNILKRLGIQT